jgi:peptidoglycan/LPS O-acetylase OafA/YrhL
MTMFNGFFNIGYVDNVYWTLLIEMKFYIFIFCLLIIKQIKNIENFVFLWLFIAALQIFVSNNLIATWFVTNYASFFVAGCLFYISASKGYSFKRVGGILATIPIGFYYENQNLAHRHVQYSIEYNSMTLFCILIGIYGLVYYSTIKVECSDRVKLFSKRLGQTSYPLYLIHLNIGIVVLNVFGDRVDKWVLFGVLIISMPIFAYVISEYIEIPVRKFLNKELFSRNS